jgi:Dolichyl-phosphate-mannose-protein mannosyltransferase
VSSAPRQTITPATAGEWRRRREASAELPPAPGDEKARNGFDGEKARNGSDNEKGRNGFRVPAYAATLRSTDTATHGFAESQRAGLTAMISLAKASAPTCEPIICRPQVTHGDSVGGGARATATSWQAVGLEGLLSSAAAAEPSVTSAVVAKVPARARRGFVIPLPLVVILTIQAVLSARLLHANTAFGDEALYLWAGHLEWSHWLHGARIPPFPTWFSGSPVIYPPIGALADSIGGLAAGRTLSLAFMLGATVMLWATALRLFDRRTAYFAAALFSVIGPTLHLGAFATYDSMSLFLMAVAAWCACGAGTREDATGWIAAAAGALALANAVKYASAIFDPIVVALAVLSAYPRPGGKTALRRGALLLTCLTGALAVLLRMGGSWYITGISQTTTMRPNGGAPVSRVLSDSWQWTAVVVVLALAGVALNILKGNSWQRTWLMAILAAAALLVPAEQAHIQTTVSLNKHLDFGAWFASIAAGYGLSCFAAWLRPWYARLIGTICLSAAMIPVAAAGIEQAQAMVNWPGAAHLIAFLKPVTSHGGRFLAETDDVPEYYLPHTSWRQWSNTFSITLPNGRQDPVDGRSEPYVQAIRHHYFSLIVLSFSQTAVMDQAITRALRATPGYKVIGIVPYGGPVPGNYTVWAYRPHSLHDAS